MLIPKENHQLTLGMDSNAAVAVPMNPKRRNTPEEENAAFFFYFKVTFVVIDVDDICCYWPFSKFRGGLGTGVMKFSIVTSYNSTNYNWCTV